MNVAFRVHEPEGLKDTPFAMRMLKLEDKIRDAEGDGIKAQWESGKELLRRRGDAKRLSNGELNELAALLGVGRTVLSPRMAVAEKYPAEAELLIAIKSYPTWMKLRASARKSHARRETKTPEGYDLHRKGLRKFLARRRGSQVTSEAEWRDLDAIYDAITRIYEEAGRV